MMQLALSYFCLNECMFKACMNKTSFLTGLNFDDEVEKTF